MALTTLDKLVPGESGVITKVTGRGAVRRRLVDMGLTTGAEIEMVKVSPLGDPVEYRLRGYHLSLRRSEAGTIVVDLVKGSPVPQQERRGPRAALSLLRCKSGQRVVIRRTRGGARLREKFAAQGFVPGRELYVVQNDFPGPLIISGEDGERMILGKGMARHILVSGVKDQTGED